MDGWLSLLASALVTGITAVYQTEGNGVFSLVVMCALSSAGFQSQSMRFLGLNIVYLLRNVHDQYETWPHLRNVFDLLDFILQPVLTDQSPSH
jgi:hypothetical protein